MLLVKQSIYLRKPKLGSVNILEVQLKSNWVGRWLVGYVKGMLSTYYNLAGV